MSFDLEQIRQLMTELENSSLRELHVKDGEFDLLLSKNENTAPAVIAAPAQAASAPVAEAVVDNTPVADANTKEIVAPLVGTVYLQPKPESPMFKSVGDQVKIGETVAIIEAMKLMTEIKSDVAGTIVEVLVENEQVVDYDKPLYRVSV
ncbi:MAG TPA: acetyl-CoA carboxylase biotin carboxyl carrier protein [Lactobacillaceae bacterium]|jgi:acetyl-CoA carboxylase biotin carboxyl carrier protein